MEKWFWDHGCGVEIGELLQPRQWAGGSCSAILSLKNVFFQVQCSSQAYCGWVFQQVSVVTKPQRVPDHHACTEESTQVTTPCIGLGMYTSNRWDSSIPVIPLHGLSSPPSTTRTRPETGHLVGSRYRRGCPNLAATIFRRLGYGYGCL